MDIRILFDEIEKEFDMQQACTDCSEWCSCWTKFKLNHMQFPLSKEDLKRIEELKKSIELGE